MKRIFTLSCISVIILSSCKVAEKQFRQGDYEEAIDISVKKLQRNPDKEEYVLLLEEAFKRANQHDLDAIKQLNYEGQPDRWEDIYSIYQSISRRQNKINPLIPLYVESEDRDAAFDFVNVVKEISNAKKNAISFWYANATNKLESEKKYDARDAYFELQKIENFDTNYKDVDELMRTAKYLGTNEVAFVVENNAHSIIPQEINMLLNEIEPKDISGNWYQFTDLDKDDNYDMSVVLSITHIDVLPEKVSVNHYEESKEVEDGVDYVYDSKGNVMKDSLGNPITVPDYEIISAHIVETFYEKIATIEGEIKYIDNKTGRVLHTVPIKGDGIFSNYIAVATGHYEAISPATRQKLGGVFIPFPNDNEMMRQAIKTLESVMQNAMQDWNEEILNG
ncbi:MAG: hypothetical protein H7Y00_11945 [Fimbriimonadaceae bacterium]|nr:hypothetical protein [Chitinophagales bacterium]